MVDFNASRVDLRLVGKDWVVFQVGNDALSEDPPWDGVIDGEPAKEELVFDRDPAFVAIVFDYLLVGDALWMEVIGVFAIRL